MKQAIVKKKTGLSAIWILPLIALIVGGWIGYTSYRDKGQIITIVFDDISGVTAGKTQLIHKGLPLGMVKEYRINYENSTITLQVEIVKEMVPHLYEDLQFWIVRPEVTTSRISGLDTLLSGSYIAMKQGTSKKTARIFTGLDSPPPIPEHAISHHIKLTTSTKGSLRTGSPILFKKIKVGEVVGVNFATDQPDINIDIVIYKSHSHLITEKSFFWNTSGVRMTADFKKGIIIDIGSLETILAGGIAVETPPDGAPLGTTPVFKLYDTRKDGLESSFKQITFDLPFSEGIALNTPIKYKGVTIGDIVAINMDKTMEIFTAKAAISPKSQQLLREGSEFWLENTALNLTHLGSLKSVMEGTYIAMRPGKGEPAHHFSVKSNPPKLLRNKDELIVILRTPRLGSLNIGSPVLYRQIVVGQVSSFSLGHTSQYVEIFVKIEGPYTPLVREHSKFWMASGIRIKGGLMTSMEIATESLESLITGGIAFATPDNDNMGHPVDTGYQFKLHEDVKKKWLAWTPEIPISFSEDFIPKNFRLPIIEQEEDEKEDPENKTKAMSEPNKIQN